MWFGPNLQSVKYSSNPNGIYLQSMQYSSAVYTLAVHQKVGVKRMYCNYPSFRAVNWVHSCIHFNSLIIIINNQPSFQRNQGRFCFENNRQKTKINLQLINVIVCLPTWPDLGQKHKSQPNYCKLSCRDTHKG